MEETSEHGNKLLAGLLDASVDGLLAFDRECRYTAWNSAMERISGLRREQVLGRRAFDLFPFLEETGEDVYFREALAGRSAVAEARPYAVPETGQSGFFDGYYSPLRDERGEVVGGVAVIRDTTAGRAAEAALRESEEALKATEYRFSMFMENLPGLAWIKDLSGRYVYVNEAAARAFGAPREELRGRTDEEIFPPATAARFRENDRLALAGGAGVLTVEELEQDDGLHHSIVSKFPIPGLGGEALLVGGIAIDITERMRAEAALRESEEKYRSLLENAHDIVYSHDLAGNYLTINRACAEITGYTREEILGGLNMAQVVVPEHRELARRMMEQKLHDPSPTVYEIDILTKDGRRLTLEVSTRLARRDGRGPIVEGIARDVTDRKRAEREREELLAREQAARREAEEASRLKDEFLATVSHELRTPLTAILGWAHMLRHDISDEATREHAFEVIERNALVQKQLVNDLLDVSRIITGRLRLEARPVELAAVVEAAREAVQPAAEAKGIRVEAAHDAGAASVLGDPDRLQQVVWNLLANAVKFTPAGGRVSLHVTRTADAAEVSVSDTGEGIEPEFLPHVFDRFRQADMGTTRRHGGLGLGLSIVRHLVELHGGSVRAASAGKGLGSTFVVTLPLWRRAEGGGRNEEAVEVVAEVAPDPPALRPPPSALLRGVRLLVVEDEPDTLEMLRLSLVRYGAEVTVAASAAEALAALGRARPEVIISDLGMAEVDGYEFLRRARALGAAAPAVALTAYAREDDRTRALDAGFHAHVPKPVEPAALAQVVADLLKAANRQS